MNGMLAAAWVIARRDFTATVFSRFFLLFLAAPIFAFVIAFFVSDLTGDADREATRPKVAVMTDIDSAAAIETAHRRLVDAVGERAVPAFVRVPPAADPEAQVMALLGDQDLNYSAVLAGTLDRPVLYGPPGATVGVSREVSLALGDARRVAALRGSGSSPSEAPVQVIETGESAGSLVMVRRLVARGALMLVFMVTVFLATMMLSNLVEEKSNKVIEVLAAAVPLDAVFLGKLIAMLGVSLVGLAVWGGLAGLGLLYFEDFIETPVKPAVGWPAFLILVFAYFATNYMLLGALFLGIGGQATNVREVQTLSMPITILQVVVFLVANASIGGSDTLGWFAMLFPLSSPLAMIAYSVETAALWPHLLALAWQMLWIAIIIRLSSRMFRATVLKTANRGSLFSLGWKKG